MEEYVEQGNRLFDRIQLEHPEWQAVLLDTQIQIPSLNPAIHEPLTIKFDAYLSAYWHRSYFYDFWQSGEEQISAVITFIEEFVQEEVLYSLKFSLNGMEGGGPINRDHRDDFLRLYEHAEIRSWLGTYDHTQGLANAQPELSS